MVRPIVQIGNDILYQKSKQIAQAEILSREIQALIQDLLDTAQAEEDSTAGLSAVQIGVLKRVFVIRRLDTKKEEWEVLLNPEVEIVNTSKYIAWEGCMSIGEGSKRLFAPVSRPQVAKVNYLDPQGEPKSLQVEDYMSHLVQHEQDHLDGKLFLQYVNNPHNIWTEKQLDEYLEKYGRYPEMV